MPLTLQDLESRAEQRAILLGRAEGTVWNLLSVIRNPDATRLNERTVELAEQLLADVRAFSNELWEGRS